MSTQKKEAVEVLDRIHNSIDYNDYSTIHDGLSEIETLADRDAELEELWARFEDVPVDPDTECTEEEFLGFPAGTYREEIWHWFDVRYSKGVYHLLYGYDGVDRTDAVAKMLYLKTLCFDCETRSCGLNDDGECKFALVHGRKPKMTDEDGCTEGSIDCFQYGAKPTSKEKAADTIRVYGDQEGAKDQLSEGDFIHFIDGPYGEVCCGVVGYIDDTNIDIDDVNGEGDSITRRLEDITLCYEGNEDEDAAYGV